MKKLLALLPAAALAALPLVVAAPATAQVVYPECTEVRIALTLGAPRVVGGSTLSIAAITTSGNTPPVGVLTVTAFGTTHTDTDNDVTIEVRTPVVESERVETITATFVGETRDGAVCGARSTTVTRTTSADVLLLPAGATAPDGTDADPGAGSVTPAGGSGTAGSSLLPDTGGERLGYLMAALALIAAGVAAVRSARRRHAPLTT
jgi:hypothetical protein